MTTQASPNPATRITVLLMEPDRMVGEYASAGLSQHGYRILRGSTPDDIQKLKKETRNPDILIVNHNLLKLAETFFSRTPGGAESVVPIVLLVGLPDVQNYLARVGEGIDDIVVKPFNTDQLALVVERVILDRRVQDTLEDFKQLAIRLQDENQRLRAVLNQRIPGGADKVLQTTSPVETKENARQDVLQSYAEQTHLVQPTTTTKTDPPQSNRN
ncbi:MAG: hypothetical protein AUJ47_04805 [Candidatus Marinimicrobia bacterium CG1_02_48_14]|nr:MAG: hypothetical protein AUJ47_04805 [Candidatus Marinimicrobia bacterium CG1_02_48_14]PIZ68553.1 MAG: hypothetical protein COY19_03585 [Candidatus Marinimicrobia bacterium CG_4_10_14_0_2_um_filter_48_9]PJA54043.1 MAG: hypothetical protein CO167_06005 [Candidatus Marinimicrobia bacterium CG_4_9_14_3_um_filter_48_9]